jgi:hypothetical protein
VGETFRNHGETRRISTATPPAPGVGIFETGQTIAAGQCEDSAEKSGISGCLMLKAMACFFQVSVTCSRVVQKVVTI